MVLRYGRAPELNAPVQLLPLWRASELLSREGASRVADSVTGCPIELHVRPASWARCTATTVKLLERNFIHTFDSTSCRERACPASRTSVQDQPVPCSIQLSAQRPPLPSQAEWCTPQEATAAGSCLRERALSRLAVQQQDEQAVGLSKRQRVGAGMAMLR